jgi:hypothetical protein
MNWRHDIIRTGGQKCKQIVCRLAFLDLPHRGPICPDTRETSYRAAFIECKPNIVAVRSAEFAKRSEGHDAAVCDAEPPLLMFAAGIANICGPAVRLHAKELFEIDRLPFRLEFSRPFIRRFHQREHYRRRVIGKHARHRWQVAGDIADRFREFADRVLAVGNAVRLHTGRSLVLSLFYFNIFCQGNQRTAVQSEND